MEIWALKTTDGVMVTHSEEGEVIGDLIAKFPPEIQAMLTGGARKITIADIPTDREFRDAWEDDGAKIDVNLTKAIAVQEGRISDAKLIVARDLNDRETAGADVAGEKVQLRAIDPASVRGAATVDQLKTMWPAQLERK